MIKTIPKSRRWKRNKWHPYGWEVAYYETIIKDGQKIRRFFSDVGVDFNAAFANSRRFLVNL